MAAGNERAAGVWTPATAQGSTDAPDSIAATASDKEWSTFRASCAMAGVQAWRSLDNGQPTFVVASHGRTRDFHSLDDARRWLGVVSGSTDA